MGRGGEAVERIDGAALAKLRAGLKAAPSKGGQVEVDSMNDEQVVSAAMEANLIDGAELRNRYVERHSEADPTIENRPHGLDTPVIDEVSAKDLYLDQVHDDLEKSTGAEHLPGVDLEAKLDILMTKQYVEERDLAERYVDHRQDVEDASELTDDELRAKVADEVQKDLGGFHDSPLDAETTAEHVKAGLIGRLSTEHAYDRSQIEGLSIAELSSMESAANAEAGAAAEATERSEITVPRIEVPLPTVDDDGSNSVGSGDGAADGASTTGTTAGSTGSSSNGGASDEATAGNSDSSTNEGGILVSVVSNDDGSTTLVTGNGVGDQYLVSADGSVTHHDGSAASPREVAQVSELVERIGAGDGYYGTVLVTDDGVVEVTEGYESTDNDSTSGDAGAEGPSDDGGSDDDGGDDDSEDDDSDDGDGTDTADDGTAESGDEEEGETTESSGGDSESGTPNPMGDDRVDPADQARFDETGFGRGQREDQIDAIDAQGSQAGTPHDDPSDFDTATFASTPVGAEMAETMKDGIDQKRNGGDTDPADLDAVESDGPIVEIKVAGGGVSDPEDGGAVPPTPFGSGVDDPTGGIPPIVVGGNTRMGDSGGPVDPTDPDGSDVVDIDFHIDDVTMVDHFGAADRDIADDLDLDLDLEDVDVDVDVDFDLGA